MSTHNHPNKKHKHRELSTESDDNSAQKSNIVKNDPLPKDFENNVRDWVHIDNKLRQLAEEAKELKKEKKPKEEQIIKYLDQNGINVIEINGGKLRRNKSETKQKLQQEDIEKVLKEKLDGKKVIEILKYMENSRQTKVNINLKRTTERTQNRKRSK